MLICRGIDKLGGNNGKLRTKVHIIIRQVEGLRVQIALTFGKGEVFAFAFVFTFVEAWFARELNNIRFFGWPLAFWFSAQGSLAIYVAIIGAYAYLMGKLDKEYQVDDGDLE